MRRTAWTALAGFVALGTAGALVLGQSGTARAVGTVPGVVERSGLVYSATGERLDVYRPSGAQRASKLPAVIFVHGGGWSTGSRRWYRAQGIRAARVGWVGVSIDYRLAPGAPFPAGADDVDAAVGWVRSHAPALGVDPARVALVGGSAGGNLVLLSALRHPGVVAVASWSGPTDLRTLASAGLVCTTSGCRPLDLGSLVTRYLGCRASACPDRAAEASPLAAVHPGAPPVFLANASHEVVPLSQQVAFTARLRGAGVPVETHVVAGRAHATQYGARIWPATMAFLRRAFSGPCGTCAPE